MIVITYDPPGVKALSWELEETDWTYGETVDIERVYGGNRKDFFDAVAEGSDTARQILLWIVRRRKEPKLELSDLDDLKVAFLAFLKAKEKADPKGPATKATATKAASAPK